MKNLHHTPPELVTSTIGDVKELLTRSAGKVKVKHVPVVLRSKDSKYEAAKVEYRPQEKLLNMQQEECFPVPRAVYTVTPVCALCSQATNVPTQAGHRKID